MQPAVTEHREALNDLQLDDEVQSQEKKSSTLLQDLEGAPSCSKHPHNLMLE